jgi:hypothetical protein
MFNGVINKTSPHVDLLEAMSGVWNQYRNGDWQIIKTPFFTVLTATLDTGRHPLPFRFSVPVPGLVYASGGDVRSVIVRPGEDAVEMPESGIMEIHVYGDMAGVEAVR